MEQQLHSLGLYLKLEIANPRFVPLFLRKPCLPTDRRFYPSLTLLLSNAQTQLVKEYSK